jgi:hypothetical protein
MNPCQQDLGYLNDETYPKYVVYGTRKHVFVQAGSLDVDADAVIVVVAVVLLLLSGSDSLVGTTTTTTTLNFDGWPYALRHPCALG